MIRIFDVETTGIDPKEDRVVEIAAYDLDDDGNIALAGDYLVNPGRAIPPQASAVHHLTDADVAGADLLGAVWARLGSDIAIYAAHNCEFEQAFIPTPAGVRWLCTYKCALRLWPDAPSHSNQVLRYWLGLDAKGLDRRIAHLAHRAGPDAYVTAWLLATMLGKAELDQLLAWTKEPKLYPLVTFGKHRGQKWEAVPGDYLVWLRDGRHDMDAGWRHGAKLELQRRGSRA